MSKKKTYFEDIIGQGKALSALSFYLDAHQRTGVFRPAFLSGSKGYGKTFVARAIGRNLLSTTTGEPKPFIELNGASVQSLKTFVESIIVPFVAGEQEVTIFFDEIHSASRKVHEWLLSVLSPNLEHKSRARFQEMDLEFNFRTFTFLAASTNQEALPKPLLDRFKKFDLEPYSDENLREILGKKTPNINFEDGSDLELVSICRGSPRQVVNIGLDVQEFCGQKGQESFDKKDCKKLRKVLGIRPLGLQANEVEHLRALRDSGSLTLTTVSAKLGLDRNTVQKDIELFLLAKRLITIDVKRAITPEGLRVLEEVETDA